MTAKKLNRRQARWSLLLARFDFLLHHCPGKTMGKSDALSWRADHGTGTEDNQNLTLLTPNLFAIWALEGLEVSGEEKDLLWQIQREMESESHEEVMIKAIKELKQSLVKSVISSEWSMENGLLRYRGKVYVPKTDLCRKIIALCHDSKIAGHCKGNWKLNLVKTSRRS